MATLFLCTIYLAFVGLGLPDSLLGAAWPAMYTSLGAGSTWAGYVAAVVSGCTVISSLLSYKLIQKMGTGLLTALSTLITAAAIFGFSLSHSYWLLLVLAVPLGLGAGAVDSGLNGYVAAHFKARQMNWLHCFWGVGTMIGPAILSASLSGGGWRQGYRIICLCQVALSVILFAFLPMWKTEKMEQRAREESDPVKVLLRKPQTLFGMAAFFLYCGMECTANVWVASYLVNTKGLGEAMAAIGSSCFFGGIMAGRFVAGIASEKVKSKQLLRIGMGLILAGLLLLLLLPGQVALAGGLLLGLGCAPVYPTLMQDTPLRTGPKNAQRVIGMQMAVAYAANVCLPSLIGSLCGAVGFTALPVCLLAGTTVMTLCLEKLYKE